jgi:hypothetical protein
MQTLLEVVVLCFAIFGMVFGFAICQTAGAHHGAEDTQRPTAGARVRVARRTRAYDALRYGGNAHQRRVCRRELRFEEALYFECPPWMTVEEFSADLRRNKLAAA